MKKLISPLLFILAAAIWGSAFSAQKIAATVQPFTLGAARSIVAGIFLVFVIMAFDKINAKENGGRRLFSGKGIDFTKYELIGGSICGTILCTASVLQQSGIGSGTDAGKAAFITALYVVLVPVFGLLFRKRAALNVWISVAIAVVGFYFLCIKDDFSIIPSDLLVLFCALIFAFHILAIDHFSPKSDGIRMSCIQFFVAAVLNFIFALFFETPLVFPTEASSILAILYLGIGSSGIAYTLQIVGQKNYSPAAASIILSLESVFGVLFAALILQERLTLREYIGCAIVFVAVILSQIDFATIIKNRSQKSKIDN